jgi:hypothetical protein
VKALDLLATNIMVAWSQAWYACTLQTYNASGRVETLGQYLSYKSSASCRPVTKSTSKALIRLVRFENFHQAQLRMNKTGPKYLRMKVRPTNTVTNAL